MKKLLENCFLECRIAFSVFYPWLAESQECGLKHPPDGDNLLI
jgi:hypothetical protein